MTDEQWAIAWKAFQLAQALPVDQRSEALRSAGIDDTLLDEVNALLELSACCTHDSRSDPAFASGQKEPELKAGAEMGRYTIFGAIGEGGFGRVYAARDRRLRRDVAIKVLHRSLTGSADHALEEARAASALNHPNILTVYETFEEGDQVAIVTELVDGGSLRQLLAERKGPLLLGEALGIARQIAAALQEAHASGISHRDIKPENVLLRRKDGLVKLVDFGLARGAFSRELDAVGDPFAGTMRYLAPEQVAGQSATPASDVFALGLVFYELVTGVHPFRRESPIDSAVAIAIADVSPPSKYSRSVPKQLDRLILGTLAKDPAARPTASQVAQRLTAMHEASHARAWLWLAALGALSALLVSMTVWKRSYESNGSEAFVSSRVTFNDGTNPIAASAISPDGGFLAYSDTTGLYQRSLTTGIVRPLKLPSALRVQHLAWSAASNTLLVSAYDPQENEYQVWKVDLPTQRTQKLSNRSRSASFSPDGQHLLFLNEDGSDMEIASAEGTGKKSFLKASDNWRFAAAVWSPDGRRILYIQQRPELEAPPVFGHDVEAHLKRQYLARNVSDGRLVASESPFAFDSLCPLQDGRLLMVRSHFLSGSREPFGIWTAQLDRKTSAILGHPELMISTSDRFIRFLSTTADGNTVSGLVEGGQADVYIAAAESVPLANAKRLTFDLRNDFPDAWTPDGGAVIFESDRSGSYHLYRQSLDSNVAEIMTDQPGDQVTASVSPDGKWLLFAQIDSSNRASLDRLFRVPLAGGPPSEVPLHHSLEEFRCPLTGKTCVIRETIGHQLYRFSALDPISGQGAVLAEVPWMLSIFGDWTIASDGSAVALPDHEKDAPQILIVPLGSSVPIRSLKVRAQGELWGIHAAPKQQAWYAEIRSGGKHKLSLIHKDGTVSVLHESDYNIWAYASPDGSKLAFVDYSLDRNVWIWHRNRP